MTIDGYKLYVKDYKLFRSAKMYEIPTFSSKMEFCYRGFEHLKLKATAMIEQRRLNELNSRFGSLIGPASHSVTIDELNIGNYVIEEYEISGSEDDYLYKVSLSLRNAQ